MTKHNQYKNQDFQLLIEKYLSGKISIEEVNKLISYYESFQETNEWAEELGSENKIKDKMLINILEFIQEKQPAKIIPFYKKAIFKYSVAASLIAFVALGTIYKLQHIKNEPTSVANTTIQIGSDKATLTLEDGSHIALDEDTSYESAKLKSDGKSLVYNKSDQNENELVEEKLVYNYLTIPRGGQFYVELSDGTKVWLNSDSKLKYPVRFEEGEPRHVELVYGEAYFDVSPSTAHKGASFHVNFNGQVINVLGTEFNVKAYQDETTNYTTLVEGKIALNTNNANEVLTPSQQAIVDTETQTISLKAVDVYNEISWKDGVFSFKGKTLKEIMKVLSRWYNVEVVFKNHTTEDIKFNGVLNKHQDLEKILTTIQKTRFINAFTIKNTKVTIE